jgi:hypothetical protein
VTKLQYLVADPGGWLHIVPKVLVEHRLITEGLPPILHHWRTKYAERIGEKFIVPDYLHARNERQKKAALEFYKRTVQSHVFRPHHIPGRLSPGKLP